MGKRNPRGAIKSRAPADFFTAFGAIIAFNARREHWTVRRGGQIVCESTDLADAMTAARETAKQG
jgi:hypothetical protein